MKKQNTTWEWLENDECRIISEVLPAVRVSSNGNKSFFNQVIAAYTGWIDKRNNPKLAVVFGDDSLLPDDVLTDLVNFMNANAVAYKWVPGRFVIVDNSVAYHSREPFEGRRVAYAAIAKGTKPVVGNQTDLVLHNGYKMPQVGFGLWKVGSDVAADCVYNAIKAGYRLLDGAYCYENEAAVGEGITRALKDKLIERKDLFVVSKLWNTYHRPEHVRAACLRTLKDNNVDYLDLFLIHFPISLKYVDPAERYYPRWFADPNVEKVEMDWTVTFQQTWHAMEELVKEGLVRSIGLSNVGTTKLMDVLKYCKIKPAVLQVEMHPYLVQDKLLRFTQETGVQVMAYSNFGALGYVQMGKTTQSDSPLINEVIVNLAKKYGKSAA